MYISQASFRDEFIEVFQFLSNSIWISLKRIEMFFFVRKGMTYSMEFVCRDWWKTSWWYSMLVFHYNNNIFLRWRDQNLFALRIAGRIITNFRRFIGTKSTQIIDENPKEKIQLFFRKFLQKRRQIGRQNHVEFFTLIITIFLTTSHWLTTSKVMRRSLFEYSLFALPLFSFPKD